MQSVKDVINSQALVKGGLICSHLWPVWNSYQIQIKAIFSTLLKWYFIVHLYCYICNTSFLSTGKVKNDFICQHGMAKIKLETSNSIPSHNSWPCNSGLQIMPLGLRDYCHLPINFNCQSYYLATNGNSFMQFTLLLIASLWPIHVCPWLCFYHLSIFFLFAKEKRWCSGFFFF